MLKGQSAAKAITVSYNPDFISWRFFRDVVKAAQESGKEAAVTRHLVGAILHLTFPEDTVDDPTGSAAGQNAALGHYLVGDTVFHIILSPVMPVYEKCQENINQGFQVFLLVPDKYFCGTRQNAEIILPGKISVASIETFVSQSLERLAGFSKSRVGEAIRQLVDTYNDRIRT
ncbi:MAG TPA: DUF4928 family protein, partial [Desulfobaccales bacterium]|nr:DUF4928 family protein [Desulfobaccales bacterium]